MTGMQKWNCDGSNRRGWTGWSPVHHAVASSSRRRALVAAACLALAGLSCFRLGAAETPEQVVEKTYGAELAKVAATKDPKDDVQLADQMIADAKEKNDDPALAKAICLRAIKLAVGEAGNAKGAEAIAQLLIDRHWDTPAEAWGALDAAADAAIGHRGWGPDDPMLEPRRDWHFHEAWALIEAQDGTGAARALDDIARFRDMQSDKFAMDRLRQLQARVNFERPMFEAVKRAVAQAKPADPKSELNAGELILAELGDWTAAAPHLLLAHDPRWNLILQMHVDRKASNRSPGDDVLPGFSGAPEAPSGDEPPLDLTGMGPGTGGATALDSKKAADVVAAGDYLLLLAGIGRRPSPIGKIALLREASALLLAAQTLDQTGVSVAQKLQWVAKQRQCDEDADKAMAELNTDYSQLENLGWIPLSTGNLQSDWKLCPSLGSWKVLPDGTLRLDNGSAATTLHSARAEPYDFVFEGEIKTLDKAHPTLLFRYHPGPIAWRMELEPGKVWWYYMRFDLDGEELFHAHCTFEPNQWNRVRVMMAGSRYRIEINGQVVADDDKMKKPPEKVTGGPGFGMFDGHSLLLRNLRIRELK
ncbi:MAG: family 16 glycoside hydrolase [Planctomycetota bacterium]